MDNTSTQQRGIQTAAAPLNTIDPLDVGRGAAEFDQWVRKVTDGVVTLERLRTVAGSLPVIGNVLALVDSVGDIVTLSQEKDPDVLDWVSLGINLIGVLPMPPNMAAARMSLRPTLFLIRQEMLLTGKSLLGDALINVLVAHLNSSIVGEIDNFVKGAQAQLSSILDKAGQWGQDAVTDIADGLEALAKGELDASGNAKEASRELRAAGNQLLHDPKASIDNFLDALWNIYKSVGKAAANTAAQTLLDDGTREFILANTKALRQFAPQIKQQVASLSNEQVAYSIGALLAALAQAVVLWRARRTHGQGAHVKSGTNSQAHRRGSDGMMEHVNKQHPTKREPSRKKDCHCLRSKTGGSISFAMGTETVSHTDFVLPGPFPIEWTRTYRSSLGAYDKGELGARWITPYTTRFDVVGDGLRYHGDDGRSLEYPLPKVGESHDDRIEALTLLRTGAHELVLSRGVQQRETYQRQGEQFRLVQIERRGGAGLLLRYGHREGDRELLSDLYAYQDDPAQPHTHLCTQVDEAGCLTGVWLMSEARPQAEARPQRRLCGYRYDRAGDLVLARDENAAEWTYQYQHHLLARYTDRTGRGMNLQWQGEGPDAKAVREWADDGSFDTRLEWDENIRLTYVTDAHGNETWHYCDILGYTYRIIHPDKRSEWLFRDEAKNVVRHVHPDGTEDRYAYDERGNMLEHIQADGSIVHYAWDSHDQLVKISDAEGGLWQGDYDTRGRLTEAIDPLGNKTEYAYNLMGLPIGITDAKGKQKQLEYNADGQLTRYVDCSGKASEWAYDERGQLARFTDACGQATRYRYEAGQLVAVTYPDQTEEQFERDAEGRLLTYVDALGRRTEWAYSQAGLLAQRVDPAGQALRYQWDKLGRLVVLCNENGREARFHYDPVGRLLAETGFDGATTRYTYDEATGTLAYAVDSQRITAYRFDPAGRLVERRAALKTGEQPPSEADWQSETFAYDGNGQLALARNAHSRLQWFRDPAGNVVREHQHYTRLGKPLVAVWQHEYDALNQRIATIRPDGHRVSWLTYGSGHLLALQLDERELVNYERDDMHREVVRQQGNRLVQTQRWDALGRLSEQVLARDTLKPEVSLKPDLFAHTGGGSRLLVRRYRYDARGQLIDLNDTRRGQLAYRYDPVGRLLEAQSRLGQETFDFDPASNLIDPAEQREAERRHMPRIKVLDNLLRQYAGTHYQYDARGNLAQRWKNGKESRYTWDLFDRLMHYEDDQLQVDYAYDALGRRLFKHSQAHYQERREAGPHWNRAARVKRNRELGCGFTLYGWDGDTLAWESTIADEDGLGASTTHYVYEPGGFLPVVQTVREDAIALLDQPTYGDYYRRDQDPLWSPPPPAPPIDSVAWYQCDHLGTPQELTDEQGEIAWGAEYRAWGVAKEVIRKASDGRVELRNPIRFQGQYYDRETGLHYNRHRYYDPEVGRFVSKDPIGYAGGLNIYQYADNPIEWIDPLGLAGRSPPGSRGGKTFTRAGKLTVRLENAARNNGNMICVRCNSNLVSPVQHRSGVRPPDNEAHVDHIRPRSRGGSGTPENGQVLCRACNLAKSDAWMDP